jgi:hypothetical protein
MNPLLTLRFPAGRAVPAADLLDGLAAEPTGGRLRVGDGRVLDFFAAFARRLVRPAVARRYPELAPLGLFLRGGQTARLLRDLGDPPETVRVPRGLILQIPPANVDTLFVYSWALSAIAGNHNVVRLSSRAAGASQLILELLNEVGGAADLAIGQTQRVVMSERDSAALPELSRACDLRVIWGTDDSIETIRRLPLGPFARDLTFPHRTSCAVLSARGWLSADPTVRRAAAIGFYHDAYWFDQSACASPQVVYWVGDQRAADAAREDFDARLLHVVRGEQVTVGASMAIEKRVNTYGLAADGDATAVRFFGNELATVDLAGPSRAPRRWLGVGTFPHARLDHLADLVAIVRRTDQTMTHFGFTGAELTELARRLAGRGIDRMVPLGEALTFSAVWDGYDLLREFTRLVAVRPDPALVR